MADSFKTPVRVRPSVPFTKRSRLLRALWKDAVLPWQGGRAKSDPERRIQHADAARLRMAVEESGERGPWRNVQAGGCMRARRGASYSSIRARSKALAMGAERKESV